MWVRPPIKNYKKRIEKPSGSVYCISRYKNTPRRCRMATTNTIFKNILGVKGIVVEKYETYTDIN